MNIYIKIEKERDMYEVSRNHRSKSVVYSYKLKIIIIISNIIFKFFIKKDHFYFFIFKKMCLTQILIFRRK